ncbi:MAG: D-alanine--D-alanine ligase [Anaerolineales bacterium]|nr:MAG: D-alanine--D-alanine ligase [Anaerolineales bacterium]
MGKMRLGVFFGGRSGEHEVSLLSARSVINALDKDRYQVIEIGITKNGEWLTGPNALQAFEQEATSNLVPVLMVPEPGNFKLYQRTEGKLFEPYLEIDAAFPMLHGTFGEDGTLQGLFELAEIPYIGAGVLASAVAMDKGLFKYVMRANDIPVLDWVVLTDVGYKQDMQAGLDHAEALGAYPLFTKPANMGSSVGIMRCENRSDLIEGVQQALAYDRRVLVERGLVAREIEISVLGNEDPTASVVGEIVPSDTFYSYKAKYVDDASELFIPARIDETLAQTAQRIAIAAYKATDCAGMARVDFLLEQGTQRLFLNEINTLPGFTKISMYPKLWEASGLTYSALLDRLVEFGIARHAQRSQLTRSYGEAL